MKYNIAMMNMSSLVVFCLSLLVRFGSYAFTTKNIITTKHTPGYTSHLLKISSQKSNSIMLDDDDDHISNEIKNLMMKHDPILLYASKLLSKTVAKDASALYAWCRRLDEITDDPNADVATIQDKLLDWEDRFAALTNGVPKDALDAALSQCLIRNEGRLSEQPFKDMIAGMKADTVDNRTIGTLEELEEYAYQVAGTVGCMLLPLLDADIDRATEPAISLGKAIQLINILRDAKADAALGRVYLPQNLLIAENIKTEDVLNLKSSDGYCRVVKEVADRAQELLREAESGKDTLPGVGPLFVQIIVELYRGYLTKLEHINYNNLNAALGERVKISTLEKVGATSRALFQVTFNTGKQNNQQIIDEEENLNKFRSLMGTLYGVAGVSHAYDCFFGSSQLLLIAGLSPFHDLSLGGQAFAVVWCAAGPLSFILSQYGDGRLADIGLISYGAIEIGGALFSPHISTIVNAIVVQAIVLAAWIYSRQKA